MRIDRLLKQGNENTGLLNDIKSALETALETVDLMMNASYSEGLGLKEGERQELIDIYGTVLKRVRDLEDLFIAGGDKKVPQNCL